MGVVVSHPRAGPGDPIRFGRLYEQAVALTGFGAWECDLATEELAWTPAVHALFEWAPETPLRRSATVALYEDESREAMQAMRARIVREGGAFTLDARIRTVRGERRWMRLTASAAWENGRVVRLFGAKQDITREKAISERLRLGAERDPLTGLANRAVFQARFLDGGGPVDPCAVAALALVDLDRFKSINDRLGHAAGDAALQEAASRLRRALPGASLVARIGGDEFAVLLRPPLNEAALVRALERVLASLRRPFLWQGQCLALGASIGAVRVDRGHERRPKDLFLEADAALYRAKDRGRGTVCVFRVDDGEGLLPLHAGSPRRG